MWAQLLLQGKLPIDADWSAALTLPWDTHLGQCATPPWRWVLELKECPVQGVPGQPRGKFVAGQQAGGALTWLFTVALSVRVQVGSLAGGGQDGSGQRTRGR